MHELSCIHSCIAGGGKLWVCAAVAALRPGFRMGFGQNKIELKFGLYESFQASLFTIALLITCEFEIVYLTY